MVMYVTLTGVVPSTAHPEIPFECPPVLSELIEKCWSDEPSKRPSFDHIHHVLNKFLQDPSAVFGKDEDTGREYHTSDEAHYRQAVSAMENGDKTAITEVAFYKLTGRDVTTVDEKGAVDLLRGQHEDSEARWMLGLCYEYGMGTGQDFKQSEELYRTSAGMGNAAGLFLMSNSSSGRGSGIMRVICM